MIIAYLGTVFEFCYEFDFEIWYGFVTYNEDTMRYRRKEFRMVWLFRNLRICGELMPQGCGTPKYLVYYLLSKRDL